MSEENIQLQISGIVTKNGKKTAFVVFEGMHEGRKCRAEGEIPECRIHSFEGFRPEEIPDLEAYLKRELQDLKKRAASISPLKAMIRPGND